MIKNLDGIVEGSIRLGKEITAPIIRDENGSDDLFLRNAADTDYTTITTTSTPSAVQNALMRRVTTMEEHPVIIIRESYVSPGSFPNNTGTPGFNIIAYDGSSWYHDGDLLEDSGAGTGEQGIVHQKAGMIFSPIKDMQVGYGPAVWMLKGHTYMSAGDDAIHSLHEVTTCLSVGRIEIPIALDGEYRSTVILPSTAKINKCEIEITEAYGAGSTISVWDGTTPDCIFAPQYCDPETINKYTLKSGMSWTATSQVVVTCLGPYTTGAGVVTIQYSNS